VIRRNQVLIGFALLGLYAASGVVNVGPDESGVAFVFGRAANARLEPGLHWTVPAPLGRVVVRKTATNLTVPVGYGGGNAAPRASARADDLWMTGGSSLVRARLDIQYTIGDLYSFLVQSESPTDGLRVAAERVTTAFLVQSSVDDILTSRRQTLRQQIQLALQDLIDGQGLGLQVRAVDIVEMSPPQDGEVDIAFQQVQSARSDRERLILNALAQQSQIAAAATARARELEQQARADTFARVELAKGESERFTRIAREHAAAPAMTERRLYLERIEKLLPRVQLHVVESSGDGRMTVRPGP
jgi:membrane protease subunit HflK